MNPPITLVLAHDEGGAIGAGDGLPWGRIPEDMKRFRDLTRGKPVVMGRRTMETLGRPLPWRHNIVLTRDRTWRMDHVAVAHSPETALLAAGDAREVMIVGGAEVYGLFQPLATRVLLTLVRGRHDADVFWAPDLAGWREKERSEIEKDGVPVCTFLAYERGG
jgi:dihydrofolate reductase